MSLGQASVEETERIGTISSKETSAGRPQVSRSQGSAKLREATQQLQPWVVVRPPRAVRNRVLMRPGECIRFPYHPKQSLPNLRPMPPGTSLLKPKPIWRPGQRDPSYRVLQRQTGPSPLWRASDGIHESQKRYNAQSSRHPSGTLFQPSSRTFLTSQRKGAPARAAAPAPQLTLEAASASNLSSVPTTSTNTEDAFLVALAKLRNLFTPDEGVDAEAGKAAAATTTTWMQGQAQKVQQAFSNVTEAQRAPLEFAKVRHQDTYDAPKLPCVFMHGLFGFSTLTPVSSLPQLTFDYWRGVVELLEENGVEVLVTNVKTSASIEERARDGLRMIEERFAGREVNLIGHSMGGLDARFLTSCLKDKSFKVKSVTSIATPHRGSPFASYLLYDVIGRKRLPTLLTAVQKLGIPGGGEAFECLTSERMKEFNEYVSDQPDVKYFSWGAAFKPGLFNEFRFPHGIIWEKEGHNDGLVSVESARWGTYRGTLKATHIEIIGWGNAIQQLLSRAGGEAPFDTRDFYLHVCEDLAREGF